MAGLYLLALIISLAGLGFIDFRYQLVVFNNWRRAARVLGLCLAVFIIWDVLGILLDIFFIGRTDLLVKISIGEFPLEELFFLLLLNYVVLVVYQYFRKIRRIA